MAKEIVSASLLKNLKYPPSPATKRRIKEDFNLGMGEWEEWSSADEGDDFQLQPLARKKRTAAKSSEPAKCKRFAEPATSAELEKLSAGVIPKNTQKNYQWALRAFNEWIQERNKRCEDKCPESLLETENAESLAKWLSLFTIEVRKKDGERYPPATIHMLLCALQRIMRRCNKQPFDIYAKKDMRFWQFHGTMETVFQQLHKDGIGAEIKHAAVILQAKVTTVFALQELLVCTNMEFRKKLFRVKVLKLSGSMRGLVFSNIKGHVNRPWRISLILQKSNWFSYQNLKYPVFCLQFIPVICQFLEWVLRLLLLILMVVLLTFLLDLL